MSRTWVKRVAGVVAAAVVLNVVLRWMDASPDPVGITVLALAVACLWWLVSDLGVHLQPTEWTAHAVQTSRRPAADGRLGVLHRAVHDTFDPRGAGTTSAHAPVTVQAVLRDATAGRLRHSHATGADETSVQVVRRLLPDRDPELAAYLLSEPAPRPEPRTLDRLISRIEAL
ncbi:hypothetical protein [Luteipulveratus halotolerans]|uniref:Uncharacterized protein n=1 Tax=Luteipulveratus halotolerans TaxID=1631356 RepID=A0A0L6CFY1_9MICO|nr:hypothetical protein [Luteipulveratus halotolerans]KNX36736.1 hypothetical protein VV01_05585 [Luteipulveratus halotolerans]